MTMRWDGNVRELRNVLLRAAAIAPGSVLQAEDVRFAGARHERAVEPVLTPERAVELLAAAAGNITQAAAQARVARTTFRRRLFEAQRSAVVARDRERPRRSARALKVADDAEALLAAE
jgi:transcriptional regulator of acetoin/glycerol metabolism